nr:ABC transporter permease [Saprospiraceae bacterium]
EQNLRQSSAIAAVSRASESPVHVEGKYFGSFRFDGLPETDKKILTQLIVDDRFGQLFGIQMAEGRWFEADNKSDLHNVILNEAAARQLGLPKPWLGQHFGFDGFEGYVVGLVRDFHFRPLHETITPLIIFNAYDWRGTFIVKTQPGQSAKALAVAEGVWKKWFPERPFEYSFLDEDFNKMYRAEQRAALLFNLFSGIAMFISCLGLFGLATFMAARRIKEIGIRKVLGASVAGITGLLAGDFLKLVALAILLASPIAYYFMQKWLAGFAYRIEISWRMFALAGATAVGIALFTVGFQAVKAALANPVKSLRSE